MLYLKFNKYERLINESNNINFEYGSLILNKNIVIKNISIILRFIYRSDKYNPDYKDLIFSIFNNFLKEDNPFYLRYYFNLLLDILINNESL